MDRELSDDKQRIADWTHVSCSSPGTGKYLVETSESFRFFRSTIRFDLVVQSRFMHQMLELDARGSDWEPSSTLHYEQCLFDRLGSSTRCRQDANGVRRACAKAY